MATYLTPPEVTEGDELDEILGRLLEELGDRLSAGEPVDLEAVCKEYPEQAEELRRLLPAIALMAEIGSQAGVSSRASSWARREAVDHAELPMTLGDFRIHSEIGRGGMGVVYEAEQRSLGRRVALKILPLAATMDPRQLQRFRLEAQAAALLHHPHIVPVFGVGCERGVHYYAMQRIDGQSLADLLGDLRRLEGQGDLPGTTTRKATPSLAEALLQGTLTKDHAAAEPMTPGDRQKADPITSPGIPGRPDATADRSWPRGTSKGNTGSSIRNRSYVQSVARIGQQAAEGLEYAHQHGVLHRDIKPGNLLLDSEGRLWITDFGLAQIQGQGHLTLTGDLLGTLRYMSPEQILGKRGSVDSQADVYALGVTLYELLTLRPAFEGKDRAAIFRKIAEQEPPPIRRLNPSVPTDLVTIVSKAMAREPADRYATAGELAEDLGRFLQECPIRARPPTLLDRLVKWTRRNTPAVAVTLGLLLFTVAGLAVGLVLIDNERAEAGRQRDIARLLAEEADGLRLRAEERSGLARLAVDEMYTKVAQDWLSTQGELSPIQREFLEKALAFYEQFAAEEGDDPQVRREAAEALERVGEIRGRLGLVREALETHQQARDAYQDLADASPDPLEFRRGVARNLVEIGRQLDRLGRLDEAEASLREALALRERLADESPDDLSLRADLARSLRSLASLLPKVGRASEGLEVAQRAFDLRSSMAAEQADDRDAQYQLADAGLGLGLALMSANKNRIAYQTLSTSIESLRSLSEGDPRHHGYLDALARCEKALGDACWRRYQPSVAADHYRRAVPLMERLADEFPDRPEYREALATMLLALGESSFSHSRFDEAEQLLNRMLVHAESLAADFPDVPDHRRRLASGLLVMGGIQGRLERNDRAREAFERSYTMMEGLMAEAPDQPLARGGLSGCCYAIAVNLATLKGAEDRDVARALELARKAVALFPESAPNHKALALAEYRAGDPDAALSAVNRSVELAQNWGYDYHWLLLALAHHGQGDQDQARLWFSLTAILMAAHGDNSAAEKDYGSLWGEAEGLLRPIGLAEPGPLMAFLEQLLAAAPDPDGRYRAQDHLIAEILADLLISQDEVGRAVELLEQGRQNQQTWYDKRFNPWFALVVLSLKEGDLDRYRALRAEMLDRFEEVRDPEDAEQIVLACCLAPLEEEDRGRPFVQVENIPDDGRNRPWAALAEGAAALRTGQDREAIARLRQVGPRSAGPPQAWTRAEQRLIQAQADLFLALAHERLGEIDEARIALERADRLVADEPVEVHPVSLKPGWHWRELAIFQILRREVAETLGVPELPEGGPSS